MFESRPKISCQLNDKYVTVRIVSHIFKRWYLIRVVKLLSVLTRALACDFISLLPWQIVLQPNSILVLTSFLRRHELYVVY